jgi:serine/threonine-protein kinase
LLDFGMAKLLGDSPVHTVSGTPLGTPLYMSPEQAKGDAVDGRADVYALGVLCHELLTGRLPIGGENTIAVLMAHIISAPPSVSEVCPDLSAELDAPVLRMLEKKPELRPATAGEARTALALAAARAGEAIPEGPPSLPRPAVDSASQREHSRETADTTLQPFSPRSLSDPERGRGALVRTAALPALKRAPHWPFWVVFFALCGAAVMRLSRGWHNAPAAPSSAAVAPSPAPPPAPPVALPSASVVSSAAAEVSAQPAPKPKKHPPGAAASAHSTIPKDLENPF